MSRVATVRRAASALVVPGRKETEKLEALASFLLVRARAAGSKFPEVKDALLGGSFAKGTWLPGHVDLDIYIRLDVGTPEERFEEVGLAVGSMVTRGYPRGKKFAQHPYTEAFVRGVRVNVVPCYAVKDKAWKSAADRSPFHVELVRRLPESQKDEVKVLKLFMKGVGVYGAEIEVQGFSGYAAEVLAIRDGSFLSVIRSFAHSKSAPAKQTFTLADPVDKDRDLAVAVSAEKLGRIMVAAREFLKAPGMAYFDDLRGRERENMRVHVMAIAFDHARLSEDVLWGELRRTLKHLVRHLEMRGFKLARAMCASDNSRSSAFLFIPEATILPGLEQRVGPTVNRRKDTDAFVASNRRSAKLVWLDEDARVRILREREYTDLPEYLALAARGKTSSIGASAEMAAGLKKGSRVLFGPALSKATKSSKWLERGVKEIVSDALGTS